MAVKNGHLEVVKFLIEHGADVHVFNDWALACAAKNGHLEVVKCLENQVKKIANINDTDIPLNI